MKKSKLSINDLKVKSFVTDFAKGEVNTVKGGNTVACYATGAETCIFACYYAER
ncbi:pinensin family lanthipeptide [Fulvivirga ulvae]|uniref:pinensin family lanthipeptide n=1 Tax=Fulvivirga ulvae TaxID=2904245 RepID=UPI001F332736|nr:pinensin family lanthipeptide [Fulvivirga ulvae]UII31766.1 pinensin family lanthipeptide [Fulvivirga ulvae]